MQISSSVAGDVSVILSSTTHTSRSRIFRHHSPASLKFIDFKMGAESGYIRFEEAGAAQKALKTHCRGNPKFNFHKYMIRALEDDFKKVVGISWYLWVFVALFLLLNINGWHTYFWLAFIPFAPEIISGSCCLDM